MNSESLLNQELLAPVQAGLVANLLAKKGLMLATAESCTGSLIAAACTDLAGSSAWFECGFVTCSNEAKTAMPGVDADLIAGHGAVSGAVVRAMAQGALKHSKAPVAVAVTGVADPSGGSVEKPVGTVWFGFSVGSQLISAMRLVPSTTENSVCRRRWTNIQYKKFVGQTAVTN